MAHKQIATSQELQEFMKENNGIVVVDCFATWCPPCKMIAPFAEEFNKKYGVALATVDVDQSPELSQSFQISAMPTFLVVKGQWNNVVKNLVGADKAKLEELFVFANNNK